MWTRSSGRTTNCTPSRRTSMSWSHGSPARSAACRRMSCSATAAAASTGTRRTGLSTGPLPRLSPGYPTRRSSTRSRRSYPASRTACGTRATPPTLRWTSAPGWIRKRPPPAATSHSTRCSCATTPARRSARRCARSRRSTGITRRWSRASHCTTPSLICCRRQARGSRSTGSGRLLLLVVALQLHRPLCGLMRLARGEGVTGTRPARFVNSISCRLSPLRRGASQSTLAVTSHVTLWRPRPGRVDRKHQDIPSGIHVTVKREAAVRTHMYANAQILLDDHATRRARLRGVGRLHGHDLRTSFFRFVRKQVLEFCQPRVMRAEGEVVIGRHEGEREVFEGNQRVGVGQLARELVPEVAALIGEALMQPGDLRGGFAAARAALLSAGQAALRDTQLRQAPAQPARVFDQGPVAERQQVAQSHGNPDHWAAMLRHDRVGQVKHQAGVPAMRPALDDHMLNRRVVRQRAVILNLDLAHVLDVEHHALAHPQLATIAVPVFQAVEAVAPLEARKARRLTRLDAAEEGHERFV